MLILTNTTCHCRRKTLRLFDVVFDVYLRRFRRGSRESLHQNLTSSLYWKGNFWRNHLSKKLKIRKVKIKIFLKRGVGTITACCCCMLLTWPVGQFQFLKENWKLKKKNWHIFVKVAQSDCRSGQCDWFRRQLGKSSLWYKGLRYSRQARLYLVSSILWWDIHYKFTAQVIRGFVFCNKERCWCIEVKCTTNT